MSHTHSTDRNPRLGSGGAFAAAWTALFALLPIVYRADVYEGSLLPRLLLVQATLALLLGGAALGERVCLPRTLTFATAALIGVTALSGAFAANPTASLLDLSQYGSLALVPITVSATLSRADLRGLLARLSLPVLPVALIGIAQFHGMGFDGIPSQARPSATFFHRNEAAEYLIVALPLAWAGVVASGERSRAWIYGLVLCLGGAFLIYTRSRGAWLGTTAGIAFLLTWHLARRPPLPARRRSLLIVGLALGGAVGLGLLTQGRPVAGRQGFDEKKSDVAATLQSITSPGGDRGRLQLWRHSLAIIADHPWLGVGPGNWASVYPAYARGEHFNASAAPRTPHSDPLWIASETGLVGLAAFLAMVALSAAAGLRALASDDGPTRLCAAALFCAVTAHLIESLFNFPRERVAGAALFWFALGGLHVLGSAAREAARPVRRAVAAAFVAAGLSVALAAGVTVRRIGYDKHHLRVVAAERASDWAAVLESGGRAAAIGPYRENTFIAMGRAHYHQGRVDQAIACYERGLAIHPNSVNAWNNLGTAFRRAGRLGEAAAALRRAVDLQPGFPEAWNNLGNVLRDFDRKADALEAYRRAAQGTGHPQILFNLGRACAESGLYSEARRSFQAALDIDAGFAPAAVALRTLPPDRADSSSSP